MESQTNTKKVNKLHYQGGYKYQTTGFFSMLTEINPPGIIFTEFITLRTDGFLFIERGYAWDGASGPTLDTKNSMRASLVHDAFYQLIREGQLPTAYRKDIDNFFYRILRKDGMSFIRAWVWWRSVRRLGWLSVIKPRKTYTAP